MSGDKNKNPNPPTSISFTFTDESDQGPSAGIPPLSPREEILPPLSQCRPTNTNTNANANTTTTTTDAVGDANSGPLTPSQALEALPTTIAGPLRTIRYSAVKDRCSLIEELQRTIPLNQFGLPEYLYRPDLLNPADFQTIPTPSRARELQEVLASAIIPVSYAQGFPSFQDTKPLWDELPWETRDDWIAFSEYLEQEGVRSLHKMISFPMDDLREWHTLHYWGIRAKAFDLYQAAHHARVRQRRILSVENNHYDAAGKLIHKAMARIERMSEEEWDNLEPLQAATIIEKMSKVQRVSVGLPALGGDEGGKISENRKVTTVELAMRRLSPVNHDEQERKDSQELDLLRDAPEAVEAAQAMLLKITTSNKE